MKPQLLPLLLIAFFGAVLMWMIDSIIWLRKRVSRLSREYDNLECQMYEMEFKRMRKEEPEE